ncbi:MAG: hypothetical protein IT307_09045 [Chloroflexi bacterium]|nr:hypothetical protein [Chloroflexota bacterium]
MASRLAAFGSERTELFERLKQVGRVLTLQAMVTWSLRGLAIGLLFDCLWLAGARFLPYGIRPYVLFIAPAVLAIVGAVLAAARRLPYQAVAQRADSRLQLRERLITAVEMQDQRTSSPLATLQLRDSVEQLRRYDALDAFPVRLPGRELNAVALLAVLAVALIVTPNPMEQTLRQREAVRVTVKQEAERINKLADDIAAQEDAEDLVDVRDFLRQAGRVVDERALSPEDAMKQLSELENKLLTQQDASVGELEDALAALAGSLASESSTRDLGMNLAKGDYRAAAREMSRLAQEAPSLSPAERAKIARALKQAASRASRADPRLAQALSQAGEGLEQGQMDDAQQGLSDAATQLDQGSSRLRSATQRERALSQLQQSRSTINRALQAAQQRANGRGQSAGSAPSLGDEGDGFGSSGAEGDPGGGDQPGGSAAGTGSGSGDDSIYDPLSTVGRPELVPGANGFDPNELYENPNPSDPDLNEAQVGYRDVLAQYQERATQSLQNTYVPAGLKDLVKDYFSSLSSNSSSSTK